MAIEGSHTMSRTVHGFVDFVAALTLCAIVSTAQARELVAREDTFITLGTIGEPIPHPERSQPANALVRGEDVVLIDCGDGTAEQLARAGLRPGSIRAVFLSHLHRAGHGDRRRIASAAWGCSRDGGAEFALQLCEGQRVGSPLQIAFVQIRLVATLDRLYGRHRPVPDRSIRNS